VSSLLFLAVACLVASVAAALFVTLAGPAARSWIRKALLVVMNLNPAPWGTWEADFSRREVFLSAWFLAFVLTLVLGAAVAWHGGAG